MRDLDILARELCYIEALRECFGQVNEILSRVATLIKAKSGDRNAQLELQRIRQLLLLGAQESAGLLGEADAQTGEIISALKALERHVAFIRNVRDELYSLALLWAPQFNKMPTWDAHPSPDAQKALSDLYRFLAPRFSRGQSILRHAVSESQAGSHARQQAIRN
jgi:hypothetical protein